MCVSMDLSCCTWLFLATSVSTWQICRYADNGDFVIGCRASFRVRLSDVASV